MSRISIYVPQTTAPGLPAPEIVPIDGSRGLLGGLKQIIETADARNQREAAERAGAPPESDDPPDPASGDTQQPGPRKDGIVGPTDPNDRTVDAIDAKEKQDASAYSANALAKLSERGLNLAQWSADSAPGHTLDVNNQFEKSFNEALAGAPNDIARQMIVRQMPRVQGEVHRAALGAEALANIAKRNADAKETLEIFGRLVQADPSQLPRKAAEALALGRSLLMSSTERKAFEDARLELPRIALSSLIDRNPEGALLEMKQGRWSQYVDSDTLKRMRSIAEHQITLGQHNADAESEFNKEHLRLDLDKFGKSLVDGQITTAADALNSPERFTDVLGKNVSKTAAETVAAQREIGTFFNTALTLGLGSVNELVSALNKSTAHQETGTRNPPVGLMPAEVDNGRLEHSDSDSGRVLTQTESQRQRIGPQTAPSMVQSESRRPSLEIGSSLDTPHTEASDGGGPRIRTSRPSDAETDRVIDDLQSQNYGRGPNGTEPIAGWAVVGPDGMHLVPGDRQTEQASATRNAPPNGAILGYHGHPPNDDWQTFAGGNQASQRKARDQFNEAQGYPGDGDLRAMRQSGKPEIIVARNRTFLIYIDDQGHPVAEVIRGEPFPPNNSEIIKQNPRLKEYINEQGWIFKNGPRAGRR